MPVPIVAIEIAEPPPDPSRELSAVLLTACSDALRNGRCVLAGEVSAPPDESAATARITWSGSRVHVEVSIAEERGNERRARELIFSDSHPSLERWRSVGFVAGTLADARMPQPSTSLDDPDAAAEGGPAAERDLAASPKGPGPLPNAAPPPSDELRVAAGPALTSSPRLWIDLGPVTGPGFADGAWRLGGFFALAYAVRSSFVQASVGYSGLPKDESGLSAHWIAPGIGAGHSLFDMQGGLSLKLRLELLLENTSVSVSAPEAPGNDSGSHWAGGLRLGSDLSWNAVPGLGMFLGGDLAVFTGRLHVDVGDDRVATTPALRPTLFGGARLSWPLSDRARRTAVQR
jgi:hypothetical protein